MAAIRISKLESFNVVGLVVVARANAQGDSPQFALADRLFEALSKVGGIGNGIPKFTVYLCKFEIADCAIVYPELGNFYFVFG